MTRALICSCYAINAILNTQIKQSVCFISVLFTIKVTFIRNEKIKLAIMA